MTKNIQPSPDSRHASVRPGIERLEKLDQLLTAGIGAEAATVGTELDASVKAYAVDALATACRYVQTDPSKVTAIVLHLDDKE